MSEMAHQIIWKKKEVNKPTMRASDYDYFRIHGL